MTYDYLDDFSIGSVLRDYLWRLFDVDWTKGLGHPDTLQMFNDDPDWDDEDVLGYVITTCLTSH